MQHKARKNLWPILLWNIGTVFSNSQRHWSLSITKIRNFLPGVQVYPGKEGYFWHVLVIAKCHCL